MNAIKMYRFRKIDTYNIDNLKNNKIWLTNPKYFNDPYDCSVYCSMDNLIKKGIAQNLINQYHDKMPNAALIELAEEEWAFFKDRINKETFNNDVYSLGIVFESIIKTVAIACFTLENMSVYMWSMYADYHQGICIEYGLDDLINYGSFGRVDYQKNADRIYKMVMTKEKNLQEIINSFILTKDISWEHEKEWRLIQYNHSLGESKGILVDSPTPLGIYLGANISQENKKKIIKIGLDSSIPIYQMELRKDNFVLKYKNIANA
jgi:hypothetical protein